MNKNFKLLPFQKKVVEQIEKNFKDGRTITLSSPKRSGWSSIYKVLMDGLLKHNERTSKELVTNEDIIRLLNIKR